MYRVILASDQAREARTKLGLSQGRVANAVGLNRTYLSLFENGKYLFPDRDLEKLHSYYSDNGAMFDGVKVFSATKQKEREDLGEQVTHWLEEHKNRVEVVDKMVTQSSDNEYHCITITVFYRRIQSSS